MKKTLYLFLTLLLFLGNISSSIAQGGESRMGNGEPYWVFGLNVGGAWQNSDIKARPGAGWGFYIGHSIFNKKDAALSSDLRLRYLNTYTYGQNANDDVFGNTVLSNPINFSYRPDSLHFAHNHETIFHDIALELRFNFEKLRRTTNVWLSIYGGIGLGIYGTKFDQLNKTGNQYDYESINYTNSESQVIGDLIAMRDDEYETFAFTDNVGDNLFQLTATPSIGAELGYWFTKSFGVGIGYRGTFTLQDDFDGIKINNNRGLNSSFHHYVSLMLDFRVTPSRPKIQCPDIQYELPTSNGQTYTTNQSSVFIKARVTNVSQTQVTYTINGQSSTNYTYNEYDDVFQSNIQLQQGTNTIVINASNECGTNGQNIVINYDPNVVPDPKQPPLVTITNPVGSPISTDVSTFNLSAQILYVDSRSNVLFTVNGSTMNSFDFTGTQFQANNIPLNEGQNTITVKGTNKDGSDSKTIIVNYQKKQPPIVNITYPGQNPYNTNIPTTNINATILYVVGANNVTCTVNGQSNNNFSFAGTNFVLNNLALVQGTNTVTITGRNDAGVDSKTITIIYQPAVVQQPPMITITYPTTNPYTTASTTENVFATILNVDSRNNVNCTINGQVYNNFSFSGTSFSINGLALVQGSNTVTINASNNVGQDSKTTVIIYQPAVVQRPPVITITYPTTNPYTTSNTAENIFATITNVDSRNNVNCTVNGQVYNNFAFSGTSFSINSLALVQGSNTITINAFNNAGQDSKTTVIIYQPVVIQRPPVVTITTPNTSPYNTANTTENIFATITNIDNRNNINCTVNGQAYSNFSFSGTSFSINGLNLVQGSNTITITAFNNAGQDSKTTIIIYQPAVRPPVVTITYPNNPHNTSSATENIIATITNVDNRNNVTCTVNGQNNNNFTFSGTAFALNNLALVQGSNTITITGRNTAGQDSKTVVIIYQPAVVQQPPVVTFTSPSQSPHTTPNSSIDITASILNVASRNDITFSINGMPSTNFNFSGTSFTANNINLRTGSNTLTITGRNSAGQDTKTMVIIYEALQPTVVITSPNTNPFNTQIANINITATIVNVATKNDITFTVNGQNIINFAFSGTSFTANNIALNIGSNTFTITGRNNAGQASASTVVIYTLPTPAPTITITNPATNPWTSPTDKVNITAVTQNVSNASQLTFTVNGQNNANFNFNGNAFTANNINLVVGNNTFVITANTPGGQATASTVVIYNQPIPAPSITITVPNTNPWTSPINQVNINATVQNVANSSQLTFTVNGQNNTNFNFNGTTFVANNIALNVGSNTFTISANTPGGQATASTVVVYNQPIPAPIITITTPSTNPWTSTVNTTNIVATTQNISNASQLTFTVNGQNNTNFNFNGSSFTANNMNLAIGSNTFTISANTPGGQATASTVVIYNPPRPEKPSVNITSPNQSPFNTMSNTIDLTATIQHVSSASDVTFTVNGQNVSNFSFSGTSFVANNIVLAVGNNTLTVTGRNAAGQDAASTVVIYTLPLPEKPSVNITSPNQSPFNTMSNTINLTATIQHVSSASDVTFTVNGQNVSNFSFSGTSFVANNIVLAVGNNTLTVTGRNAAGQDAASTVVIYTLPLPEKPSVNITSPNQSPFNTMSNTINLTATIQHVSSASDVTFTVNGQNVSNFSFSGTSFVANNIVLAVGNNTLTVTGRNTAGQDAASTVVIYTLPLPEKPSVNITSPNQSPFNTTNNTINLTATIQHVSSASDVTFTVNGQNISNFSFSGTSFVANNIVLAVGNNTLTVTGRNTAGQDAASTVVIYTQPLPQPIVTIVSPNPNPFTTQNNTINLTATIQHVSSASDVTFTVNGQINGNFSFSGTNFNANGITLNPGNNTLTVTGRNASGQASASTVVVYNQPSPAPIVTFTDPSQDPTSTTSSTANITATIQYVAGPSDITFTVNGQNITNFSFAGINFSANNVALTPGYNTITLTGRNNSGQDTKSVTIRYKLGEPSIQITAPGSNPWTSPVDKVNITAVTQNVLNANQLSFTINGQPSTDFSFNGNAFTANNINLIVGNNVFEITATTPSGQVMATTEVIYNGTGNGGNGSQVNPNNNNNGGTQIPNNGGGNKEKGEPDGGGTKINPEKSPEDKPK